MRPPMPGTAFLLVVNPQVRSQAYRPATARPLSRPRLAGLDRH
jgi:hypothetical protein